MVTKSLVIACDGDRGCIVVTLRADGLRTMYTYIPDDDTVMPVSGWTADVIHGITIKEANLIQGFNVMPSDLL